MDQYRKVVGVSSAIVAILSLGFVTQALAIPCKYHVDASAGYDGNHGLSETAAWKTVGKVNETMTANALQPGDVVCFKRGEIWHEQLTISQSGTETEPLIFTAYDSGANPLIVRSDPTAWWQFSLADGGFERFHENVLDVDNPNFDWPWYEVRGTDALVAVDPSSALVGNYAARLTRLNSSAAIPMVRMQRGVSQGAQHYLRFYSKTDGDAALSVRIRDFDDDPTTPTYWLQEDLSTWATTPASITMLSSSDYVRDHLVFTTRPDSNRLDVRFELRDGVGSGWIDEVLLLEGNAEPVAKIWQGRFVDPTVGKIYGLQDKGQRVPMRSGIDPALLLSDPTLLEDQQAISISDAAGILYRRDYGDLVDIEVGRRVNAIRVEAQQHIVIDAIDARGAGARPHGVSGESFGAGLVFISPGSSSVTVQNSTSSQSSGNAISAGNYNNPNNPFNITYDNVVAYDNGSTGLYIRGSGKIIKSLSYNNGTQEGDTGDRGGIGLQEGPSIIEDNEIHTLGHGDRDIDFAISICCNLKGAFEVRRNYVHDVSTGALQIAGNGQPFDHVIEYNVFDRYGQNTTTDGVAYGKFAGIRLVDAPSTRINNNVIANGGDHHTANGVLLRKNVRNVTIANNLFFNNKHADIRGVADLLDANGWASNRNSFWRDDFSDAWWWENTKYSSLSAWNLALQQDLNSLQVDPLLVSQYPASAGDYALSVLSPLIDAGMPLPDSGGDYEGNPIIASADIGAHEFGSKVLGDQETTLMGSRSGSMADLLDSDSAYEAITEEYIRKKGGLSQLEHIWYFGNITPSPSLTLYVQAHHTPNTEGDNFLFQYRANDGSWVDLLVVDKAQADASYQTATIPAGISSPLELRVTDTDQSGKNIGLDTLYIDHMFIRAH